MEFLQRFELDEELIRKTGFNPYYPKIQSALEDPILIEGEKYINLASNNYLGLANDPRVKEACINAIKMYGVSMCATPIASGYTELFNSIEQKLAEFIGLEDVLIYPSCYQANNGLFSVIAGKDDVILVDRFAHSSLVEGIRSVGCKIRPYLHNNLNNLETILKKSTGFKQIFVVTESVFSTDGSITSFKDIVKLCDKYNALPVVDDSHGIGVIGDNGKGVLEHHGITDFHGIYTTSLGKALANSGGIIGGNKTIINYLRYYSSHLVYSTAIPPSILGGIEKVLDIIKSEFSSIKKVMWNYKNMISSSLVESGIEIADAKTPITSIIAGDSQNTILFAKRLFEDKILSTPFIYPSVPLSKGVIRLIAGANLKEGTVQRATDIFRNIKIMDK